MQQKKTKTILNAAKRKRYTLFSVGHWMTGKYHLRVFCTFQIAEERIGKLCGPNYAVPRANFSNALN
jgi:hypothetical protein